MASPNAVTVRVSGPTGMGSLDGKGVVATVTIPKGAASAPLTYIPAKAGAYALAAQPDAVSLPAPIVPGAILAPGAIQVQIPYYDANGVPYPLARGETLDVASAGPGALTAVHAATGGADGVWTATVPIAAAASGRYLALATEIRTTGGSVGSVSGPVQSLAVSGAAPGLSAQATPSGVVLAVSGPAPSTGGPIAYAVYRVPGNAASLPAGTAPVAVVDPLAGDAGSASYVDPAPAGACTYFAAALYAAGAVGPPSAGAAVAPRSSAPKAGELRAPAQVAAP